MMKKLLQPLPFQSLIIPCIIFLALVFSYGTYSHTIPVAIWDEVLFVGKSYFFDFYIHGDFKNRIWQSSEAYDQPKLAEYSYGAWLHPLYLKEKGNNEEPFDYAQFLIKNGLYFIDEKYSDAYSNYKNNFNIIRFYGRDEGFPAQYVAKYGTDVLKPLNLIYSARTLNLFVLAGAVIFVYFFALQNIGVIGAMIFSLYYGFNFLIIDSGLRTHSEALFLFTFNAAFLFMNLYFVKGRKLLYLLLFSLFAGLCMSTKLNGSMLTVIFLISNTILFFISKAKKIEHILISLLPILISLVVFVSLNPFTFSDPIKKVPYMFDYRMKTAYSQVSGRFKAQFLPDGISRVKKIYENFYFSERASSFNGIKIFEKLGKLKNYGAYLFILFTLGFFYSLKLVFKKNIAVIVTVCSFITILALMSFYLILDYAPYYVQLSFFFLMFQSLGLYSVIKYVYKYTKLLALRAINRKRKK